jgi:hypothetical protein
VRSGIPHQEGAAPKALKRYAEVCGWTPARAHAKSGDAATISGYLVRIKMNATMLR